jgi:hypothetical protein
MSSIAVFLVVAGGSALAAGHLGKNTVGSKQLKKNAVTAAKIKKNAVTAAKIKDGAVTGAKVNVSGFPTVPSATSATSASHANTADNATHATSAGTADRAASAGTADHAASATSVDDVHVFKAGAVPAAASYASAPRVELGSVGPFHFYGKCFEANSRVVEETYIALTSGTATLGSEGGATLTNEYLTPSTPEEDREMSNAETENDGIDTTSYDEEFQASASDGTEITGLIGGVGAKMGNPSAGNGPFLSGNSCIVGAIAVFGG